MKKRGQFWYSDFMIGIIIMMTIGLLFFSTIFKLYESNDKIGELISDGVLISDYFMSSGYDSENWGSGNGRIGFVDNGKVNENFENFQLLDYDTSKFLLGIHYDYVVYFEDSLGNFLDLGEDDFIGYEIGGIEQIELIDTDHMVKLARFVYYGGDIQKMVVVLWA